MTHRLAGKKVADVVGAVADPRGVTVKSDAGGAKGSTKST